MRVKTARQRASFAGVRLRTRAHAQTGKVFRDETAKAVEFAAWKPGWHREQISLMPVGPTEAARK